MQTAIAEAPLRKQADVRYPTMAAPHVTVNKVRPPSFVY